MRSVPRMTPTAPPTRPMTKPKSAAGPTFGSVRSRDATGEKSRSSPFQASTAAMPAKSRSVGTRCP